MPVGRVRGALGNPLIAGGLLFLLALVPCPSTGAAIADGELTRDFVAFLRNEGRLTAADLGTIERGGVVAKVVDTGDRSEVFSVAATRVTTKSGRVAERFKDLEGRRAEPWVLQIGRVGTPPNARDLESLSLDPGDVKDLAKCRVNHCDLRLPADAIEQFRKEIDWSDASHATRANALFRQLLSSYVASYLGRGNTALIEYATNLDPGPVRIADSLQQLLIRSEFLRDAVPDLYAFLHRFPDGRPTDVEDFVYWLKEKFWLLNVLSLNHVTLVDRPTGSGRVVLAVSKQLYASHYYESSLGVTAFLEGAPGTPSYLVMINRTRADIRRSGFTWIERLLLRRLVRGRLEGEMKYLRRQLEAA